MISDGFCRLGIWKGSKGSSGLEALRGLQSDGSWTWRSREPARLLSLLRSTQGSSTWPPNCASVASSTKVDLGQAAAFLAKHGSSVIGPVPQATVTLPFVT